MDVVGMKQNDARRDTVLGQTCFNLKYVCMISGEKCDTSLVPRFKPTDSTSIGAFPKNKDLKFGT